MKFYDCQKFKSLFLLPSSFLVLKYEIVLNEDKFYSEKNVSNVLSYPFYIVFCFHFYLNIYINKTFSLEDLIG
jgi:hypothetical protein